MDNMQEYLYNLATDKYEGGLATILKAVLFILSLVYGLIVRILIFLSGILPYRLNCKVISIGNITLGGTGKTSLVEFICRALKEKGHKVAILSRGYKRKSARAQGLKNPSYETMGDEPYMLSKSLGDVPILVDANRVRAARQAIHNYQADTVILDDGFQQWRIIKDLEIVTIDAAHPFGNRHLIPRGILREPLSSLKRADIFILTKTNLNPDIPKIKDFLNRINPAAEIFECIHKPAGFYKIGKPNELLNTEILQKKTVTLFSGIGDPWSFENLIKILNIQVGLSFRFRDHHNYAKKDLERIVRASKEKNINTIITTEKDAARLGAIDYTLYAIQILVLRIKLEIKNEQEFHHRLLQLYSL